MGTKKRYVLTYPHLVPVIDFLFLLFFFFFNPYPFTIPSTCILPIWLNEWIVEQLLFWGSAIVIINDSSNNASRKAAKKSYKARKKQSDRNQLLAKTVNPADKSVSINWREVKYEELDLYPAIPLNKDGKPTRPPTTDEMRSALDEVDSFHLFQTGRNVVVDPNDKESVIAYIKFTKYEDLSAKDKTDLNFLSTFLHRSKEFISPVAVTTRSWGGLMWAIGWRKSSDKDQIIGKYIKQFDIDKMIEFDKLFTESDRVGDIIAKHFKSLANTPFKDNQELMERYNIPSFASLDFEQDKSENDCSPHLVFTTNGFYNAPHIDEEDVSQFAFAMFLPTFTSDGTLASASAGYDLTSGPFVFPDHKFGINFDHQHGVVKMIWQANRYKHCTMPSTTSSRFTRLAMSCQINLRLVNACDRVQKGLYDEPQYYYGDHFYYLFRTAVFASFMVVTFFITLF